MSTSTAILDLANTVAPTEGTFTDERILIPECESVRLVVRSAEIRPMELRTFNDRQFYSSSLSVTFIVDDERVREETMEDTPLIFHTVRIDCKTDENGENPSFDWVKNLAFKKFFKIMGAPVLVGTKGQQTWRSGSMAEWLIDLEGRRAYGKIIHKPAQRQVNGVWEAKVDEEGEVIYRAEIAALSSFS
jgi:hypothetical protein